jgi:uncharacterized protein (DUF2062 family)
MIEVKASLWQRWVIRPIIQQLTQGVSPSKIAQAIAYGMTLGVFPILGSTTLLTLLVGVPLRLNQPILQAFKTLTYPMQWASLMGFYRAGEWLFNAPHVSIHIPTMMKRFFAEPEPFFRDYGMTALYGIAVWCLLAPAVGLIIYFVTKLLVEKLATLKNSRSLPASP